MKGNLVERVLNKRYYFAFDVLRIICAICIFGRHAQTMAGFSFDSRLNILFINLTTDIMTTFFVLSGFSIYLSNKRKRLNSGEAIIYFYKKRAINILPVYFAIHVIYIIINRGDILNSLIITPVEILGIQTIFNSLFTVLHNGGTWFVSCLIISYFIYPILQNVLEYLRLRSKVILLTIALLLIVYLPFVQVRFGCEGLYSNPYYRAIQFMFGVVLASLKDNLYEKAVKHKNYICIGVCFLCIFIVCVDSYKNILLLKNWNIIFIAIGIYLATFIEYDKLDNSKILRYCNKLTYGFFIWQLILWKPSLYIIEKMNLFDWEYKVIIPFVLLVIITIVMHELYEKPVQRFCNKKVIVRENE